MGTRTLSGYGHRAYRMAALSPGRTGIEAVSGRLEREIAFELRSSRRLKRKKRVFNRGEE